MCALYFSQPVRLVAGPLRKRGKDAKRSGGTGVKGHGRGKYASLRSAVATGVRMLLS